MKNNFLPFQIGEQYENWEFNLEYLTDERIEGFDSYYYLSKVQFLSIVPTKVELIFSLDILEIVIMTMQFHSRREKKCFIKTLKKDFESKNQIEKEGKVIEVFYLDENTEIWMIQYNTTNMIEISYGPIKYIRKKNNHYKFPYYDSKFSYTCCISGHYLK